MELYLKKNNDVAAIAECKIEEKKFVVLKGSKVSPLISYSEKFRGAKAIEKIRDGKINNNILLEDVTFKSASTAANFVTGCSTNGLKYWKDKNGKSLKELLPQKGEE